MKKYIVFVAFFTCALLQAGAQSAIHFTAVYPDNDKLSLDVREGLKQKVEQIIGRNNAGATSVYNAFILLPELNVQETKSTEGLVRNVTLVKGELTLTARNLYDESIYGTVVVSLEGDATGDREAALKALLKNIKITNPAFTRFIRTTREKITNHYMDNCQTIMTKAQTMISTDKIEEAMGYLGSVPEVVPCYEDISSLMALAYSHAKTLACDQKVLMARSKYVMGDYESALELLAEVPSSSTCREEARALTDSIAKYINLVPDTVFIDRQTIVEVEKPVVVEKIVEKVVEVEAPASKPAAQYKLNVSCPELGFDLISCAGSASSRTIMIYCRLTNNGKGGNASIYIADAIDGNGSKYTDFSQSTMYGCSDSQYSNNMPTGIPISKCFVIRDLTQKLDKLAYVEIRVGNCKIELRDVPVTWP